MRGACVVQEVAFPYMLDERHPQDSVFFFFESDFRFWKRDDIGVETWLPLCMGQRLQAPAGAASSSSGAAPAQASGGAASSWLAAGSSSAGGAVRPPAPEPMHSQTNWQFRQTTMSHKHVGQRPSEVSQELAEMVLTMNLAARSGCGDVVWFSWNAADPGYKPKRAWHPNHGSQCIGFTTKAARLILQEMKKEKPQLFDLWLLNKLKWKEDLLATSMGSAYVYPPIGGYSAHETAIMKDNAVRESCWDEKWACDGLGAPHRIG